MPHRVLVGPWSHLSPSASLPGPGIDLTREMARWFDRFLRGPKSGTPRNHRSCSTCGTRAALGAATDQRGDDAWSITRDFEVPDGGLDVVGFPRAVVRLAASQPVAALSVKLCDVHPDGASELVTRGFLNLADRDGHEQPSPVPVDEDITVTVVLDGIAWRFRPGHRIRVALAGTDWPNALAAPQPFALDVALAESRIELPVVPADAWVEAPPLPAIHDPAPGAEDVIWRTEHDVLRRRTACVVDYGDDEPIAGGRCVARSSGRVEVDLDSFDQEVDATSTFAVTWDDTTATTRARVRCSADAETLTVVAELDVTEGGREVARRVWERSVPRDLQ